MCVCMHVKIYEGRRWIRMILLNFIYSRKNNTIYFLHECNQHELIVGTTLLPVWHIVLLHFFCLEMAQNPNSASTLAKFKHLSAHDLDAISLFTEATMLTTQQSVKILFVNFLVSLIWLYLTFITCSLSMFQMLLFFRIIRQHQY